jgi:hypothetical protein
MINFAVILAGGYWAWFGTIYLAWLTWQDFKNNMVVDDRKNWFMLGMTLSLYSHFIHKGWYPFILLAVVIIMSILLSRFNIVGAADISTIRWVFWGFGIINPYITMWWLLFFAAAYSIWLGIRKALKIPAWQKLPFYPVILSSFLLNCFMFGLLGL